MISKLSILVAIFAPTIRTAFSEECWGGRLTLGCLMTLSRSSAMNARDMNRLPVNVRESHL